MAENNSMQLLLDGEAELRATPQTTFRDTSPAMEGLLYKPFPVLDHGFIRLMDYMGDEGSIVQAARVSYGKGTKKVSEDRGLIRYLIRHWHTTPLEMCEIKVHAKMPIFVARQWVRHRTASLNEYSGRYSVMDREFYVPDASRLGVQSTSNKQGTDADDLTEEQQAQVLSILKRDAAAAWDGYDELLNDHNLARELARINLPMSAYTQWYWKIDLKNLMHFLALRADSHAQEEIRVYAQIMCDMVEAWLPNVYEAWDDYHPYRKAHNFSGPEVEAVGALVEMATAKHSHEEIRGLLLPLLKGKSSKREIKEFFTSLGINR